MLTSRLFAGDTVLEAVAADTDRISRSRHGTDPAVGKVQTALLTVFDAGCLPVFGPDGKYGDETAGAVERFKVTVLGVAAATVIDDVGPGTVRELDRLMHEHELSLDSAARIALLEGWLNVPVAGFSSAVTSSGVHAHQSGEAAFAAFHDALARCSGEGSFVAIAGWDFFPDTPLVPGVTVGAALSAAAGRGVAVRAMFSHFPVVRTVLGEFAILPGDNAGPVAFVNGLPGGAAIHDEWVLLHQFPLVGPVQVGMHHQKIWVVFDGQRLQAFCGGIDLNPNRTAVDRPGTIPFHDVQVEVGGPAAEAVYLVVRERWNNHPSRPAGVELRPVPVGSSSAGQRARVLTTFGNPGAFAGLAGPPYPFAPSGSTAIRQFLSAAIGRAERFIYLEDQYLVDASVGRELAARMPVLQGLVIVLPDDNSVNAELRQTGRRRKAVLDPLLPFLDRIAIVNADHFVHAKMWIFDDTVALVGSANSNRRGASHDSEIAVAFGDIDEPGEVMALRTALWNTHLGRSPRPRTPRRTAASGSGSRPAPPPARTSTSTCCRPAPTRRPTR